MPIEIVNFKTSSALKDLIGQDLITNDYVAVFELVKNSFDAWANIIEVSFDLQKNEITISDNGFGMSKDDVINKWLFIGYSDKKNDKNAAYSGNKGIGRFSCDRLGEKLELITTKNGQKSTIDIDWNSFEEDQNKEIQTISFKLKYDSTTEKNGTIIHIKELKESWDKDKIDKTKRQLSKLIVPVLYDDKQKLFVRIIDAKGNELERTRITNSVFSYMEEKTTYIRCIFDNESITSCLYSGNKLYIKNVSNNNSLIKNARIQVYFADTNAKSIFKRKTGLDLINYGNIFVYKNKFRVFPYGEVSFDIFGLAQRKTQGYNRYLGPREIFGWIDLIDTDNNFKESTSRDRGFKENEYYNNLVEVYFEYVHRPLEKYIELINYGNVLVDDLLLSPAGDIVLDEMTRVFKFKDTRKLDISEDLVVQSTSAEKKLNDIEKLKISDRKKIIKEVQKQIINQKKELELVVEEKNKKEAEISSLKKEIQIKNKYFEIDNPQRQSFIEHDLGIVLGQLEDSMITIVKKNRVVNDDVFSEHIKVLAWAISRIKGIRSFILKTNMDTKSDCDIEIGSFLNEYVGNIYKKAIKITVKVLNEYILHMNVFDLITIIDNCISNAKSLNATKMNIFVDNDLKIYTDTYQDNNMIDFSRVFDFGYSTTGNTGMGMFIIKQICDENHLKIEMTHVDKTNLVLLRIYNEKND